MSYKSGITKEQTRWHTLPRTHTAPPPPRRFLYLTETKSCKWEGGGEEEGEKVSLKTHATARGVGILLFLY